MKRVLFLTYHWPPIGGAHTQRPVSLAECFPDLGYESVIVTGPESVASGRWTPADATLDARLDKEVETHRIPQSEPQPSAGWRERSERWLGLRSSWAGWWIEGAVALGTRAGAGADVIYASMQPYESAEAAARLSRILDRPWVADLTDPWALDEMMIYPTSAHRWRELRRMRFLLRSAAAIAMSTPEAAHRLCSRFPEFRDRPVLSVPNGYWAPDFELPPPPRKDAAFRIVHTGYLHTALGLRHRRMRRLRRFLGGAIQPIDILTRSHIYLLNAIDRLIAADPTLASLIEVHLAGVLSSVDREIADPRSYVRLLGYCAHDDTIDLIRTADLLFLPMHNLPPGVRASIVPGKTYEYLAAGRPILAAVPDGDARDILSAAGTASVCRPDDLSSMARIIGRLIDDFKDGRRTTKPPPLELIARYDYRTIARQLTRMFDAAINGNEGDRLPLPVAASDPD